MYPNRHRLFSQSPHLLLLLGIIALSGCQSTGDRSRELFPLHGMVYDGKSRSISHATITLDEGPSTISDINGRFSFQDIPLGDHILLIEKDGYVTKNLAFLFANKTEVLYIQIQSVDDLIDSFILFLQNNRYENARLMINQLESMVENPKAYFALALYYSAVKNWRSSNEYLQNLSQMGYINEATEKLRELNRRYEEVSEQ